MMNGGGHSNNNVASAFGSGEARMSMLKSQANELLTAGNFAQAIAVYTTAVESSDESAMLPVLLSNRAMAHIKLEAYGLAIADAEQAIKLDPSYVKAYYRRGSANLAIGKYKLALRDFKAVCKLRPNDRDARNKLKECEKAAKQMAFASAIESGENDASKVIDVESIPVEDSYDGPRIVDDVTDDFVVACMERFRDQKLVHKRYVVQILQRVRDVLDGEASLVDLSLPGGDDDDDDDDDDRTLSSSAADDKEDDEPKKRRYTICGDVHGQFYDLLNIFRINGNPSKYNPYVFNGDFVDRGSFSFEVVFTLFAWKVARPQSVHLNRGNHETKNMTKIYGFEGEVKHKFNQSILQLFHECFCALPLAACLEKSIFIVHGGLSGTGDVSLDDVRNVKRKVEPPDSGLMCDLLWSDPQVAPGRSPSKRGVGLSFGPDVTATFLTKNNLTKVIRSHEVRDLGYEEEHHGQLITVFSAPNYCDAMGNKGAFVHVGPDLQPSFTTFDAVPHPNIRPMAYASPAFGL
mmetsp:Transcript_8156/g.25174  ORF Transcript_8156/g.25174 Transcript_8156/m.25174 type:complete len:519 (-) Transcript_8156:355-1911(-)